MRERLGSVLFAGKLITDNYLLRIHYTIDYVASRELAVAVEANFIEVDGFISKIIQETQRTRCEIAIIQHKMLC